MTLYPGLVSITFRDLDPETIVDLTRTAGLAGIEWGGDVHVPPGDIQQARTVKRLTTGAGLKVSAYGSYYRLKAEEPQSFAAVLATAVALGAPVIRVWAGDQTPDSVEAEDRQALAARARQIATLAAAEGIQIAFEYHRGTLTETSGAALELLRAVDLPNVRTFWQPHNGRLPTENIAGFEAVKPWISHIHCFHWWPTARDRHPLAAGEAAWRIYLEAIRALPGDRFVSLEFVQNGQPEQFLQDAATLKRWLAQYG